MIPQLCAFAVKVKIILIAGMGGVNQYDAKNIFYTVRSQYCIELGIDLKLTTLRNRKDLFPQFKSLSAQQQRYNAWKAWLISKNRLRTKRLTYLMFPPMPEGGKLWIGGLSSTICGYGKTKSFSMGNAELYNQDNAPRYNHSIAIMKHELGHLVGADHDNSQPVTVMYSAPLPSVDSMGILPFSELSKSQIYNCLGL